MTTAQIFIMGTIIAYLCFVIVTGIMIGRKSKKSAEGFYLHYNQVLADKYMFDPLTFIDAMSGWHIPTDPEKPGRKMQLLVNSDDMTGRPLLWRIPL